MGHMSNTETEAKRVLVNIDEELHHKFKVMCLQNKELMQDVVAKLMQQYIDESNSRKKNANKKGNRS